METRAAKRLRLELQDSEDTIQEESQVLKNRGLKINNLRRNYSESQNHLPLKQISKMPWSQSQNYLMRFG